MTVDGRCCCRSETGDDPVDVGGDMAMGSVFVSGSGAAVLLSCYLSSVGDGCCCPCPLFLYR